MSFSDILKIILKKDALFHFLEIFKLESKFPSSVTK
jgi:hypothetical protein